MSTAQPRVSDGPKDRTALILSAGAPHSPLMAGALYAIHRKRRLEGKLKKNGKLFDIIYTSGAGGLIGLLLAAPKSKGPEDLEAPERALESVLELAVSDPIYSMLPINYKAFFKPGPFTRPFQRMARLFKLGEYPLLPIEAPRSPLGQWYNYWANVGNAWVNHNEANRRLFNDLIDLWTAAITPTTLTFLSKGFCTPLPFIEDVVDFEKLNKEDSDFFLNFFTPRDFIAANQASGGGPYVHRPTEPVRSGVAMGVFKSRSITPEHVRAAFAYPLVYEPVRVRIPPAKEGLAATEELGFEGANWEPISFGNLLSEDKGVLRGSEIKTVVLVDILTKLQTLLLREPRNLWDAFGLLIIFPVVAHAKKELARFESELVEGPGGFKYHKKFKFKFVKIEFELDEPEIGHDKGSLGLDEAQLRRKKNDSEQILDWSYSNMSRMFQKGREAGERFCLKHGDDL
jgi:hypothetical protein